MPAKKTAKKKATKKTAKKAAAKSTKKKVAKKVTKKTAKKAKSSRRPEDILVSPMFGEPYQPKKKEEYMSDNMEAHFRNILMLWKKELMEEVDRTMGHLKDEAANFPDPNDRASQETEFSLELRTRDRERKLIKKIDESLELLDNGEYGFCDACGVEIGIRRLEARPTATQCIDCKTLDEIREKQMG
jgi:DnaK suppressor protein